MNWYVSRCTVQNLAFEIFDNKGQLVQIQVLHKTLDILEALKNQTEGLSLAAAARQVKMPKATVYRILNTLEARGYLDRQSEGSYRISNKLFALQSPKSLEETLRSAAQPVMERLAIECRETVNLGVLDAGEVVVIATVESPQAIRMSSKVGNRRLMHTTALGKVLLAGIDDSEIRRLARLKGLPALTPKSIGTIAALLAEVHSVRKRGYALDNQENELDGRCLAAPIRGADGQVVAALSVSGPVFRMDLRRIRSLQPALGASCQDISQALAG